MLPHFPRSERAVALVIVIALVAVMTFLSVTFFVSISGETRASQQQSDTEQARQLASSATQMTMSQIQAATTRTVAGTGDAVAWTSQPGLLRTFTATGPSTVYKLYSDEKMVTDDFDDTRYDPPADWNASPALYCDINIPAWVTGSAGALAYPVADPNAAGVVPGFRLRPAPGYTSANATSPTNNPLPMPVRWLYILKDGQIATPASSAADGTVTFAPAPSPQPSSTNPVIGRIAFWADDETCKVNVNTAGYARNDASYSTYWDTPVAYTQFEDRFLSNALPWTNEFLRYPGHPATTGLNVVFNDLNLSADQIANLTPRYRQGGTNGGTIPSGTVAPTQAAVNALLKNQRMYPTIDEFFYDPARTGSNAAAISSTVLEQRRFLLTACGRAPETTLMDTPRVTIWPTWEDATKRTPVDQLLAFCSTLSGQPFYFMRSNPLSTRELLDIPSNLSLFNYLQTLTGRNLPGVGGNFRSKYSPKQNRDQILTSIFDAIRLANLDDRSTPGAGKTAGWSFTAGQLRLSGSTWIPLNSSFNVGYVAPPDGPSNTRGAGRASTLAEVALLFARPSNSTTVDSNGVRECDKVNAAMLYGFFTPSAGMVIPGQNRRIEVSGLSGLKVQVGTTGTLQQLFTSDTFSNTQVDKGPTTYFRRGFGEGSACMGGVEWTMSSQASDASGKLQGFMPPTANLVLPYDPANPTVSNTSTITLTGTTLNISVYSPATSTTPLQTFQVAFLDAQVLTPMPTTNARNAWTVAVNGGNGRFGSAAFEGNLSTLGDTVVAMQNRTGDYRSEILRSLLISDFRPHIRYGEIDNLGGDVRWNRRASSLKTDGAPALSPSLVTTLFGNLVDGWNGYDWTQIPSLPSLPSGSIQSNFPPGDFSNGPGLCPDGSWSPKTDEGKSVGLGAFLVGTPYFRSSNASNEGEEGTLTSPNRQMPSAVFFGSVPTGVYSSPPAPWRTLLFRPARTFHMGGTSHRGAQSPPDYFLLDLFHMPIVEPYAISEPFSTAGKVNMNARLVPFSSYLTRETALHAVLRSARLTAIPEGMFNIANPTPPNGASDKPSRYPLFIDNEDGTADGTLASFRDRYDGADGSGRRVFLTSGEVCSLDLVPDNFTRSSLGSFWADKRATGDNSREAPYSAIVPRLTTRSNTFTVYATAQALSPGPGQFGWRENKKFIRSEWRGATTVERYVDPNDVRFIGTDAPNFLSGTQTVGPYYRFRVIGTRRFDP